MVVTFVRAGVLSADRSKVACIRPDLGDPTTLGAAQFVCQQLRAFEQNCKVGMDKYAESTYR